MVNSNDIIKVADAKCIQVLEGEFDISTDSRLACKGKIFLALKGDKFDGHEYVQMAVQNGAVAVIVDIQQAVDIPQFIVADTLVAYQALAACNRLKTKLPLVGITGTNGKTTVKDLLQSILSQIGSSYASYKNYNNHIGVPASLLNICGENDYAIIEMGMNHAGEISVLTKIAQPDVAVITCIGRAHLEFMQNTDKIAAAKAEIFDGVKAGGIAILPFEDKYFTTLSRAAESKGLKVISFGQSSAADIVFVIDRIKIDQIEGTLKTDDFNITLSIPITGRHNGSNIAAAIAAALAIAPKITGQQIAAGLKSVSGMEMRCETIQHAEVTIIMDCYNANPESAKAAALLLSELDCNGRKIALFGDMLELGPDSDNLHYEVGQTLGTSQIGQVLLIGKFSNAYQAGALDAGFTEENIEIFESTDELVAWFEANAKREDIVLVKGSRGAKLEEVVKKWII